MIDQYILGADIGGSHITSMLVDIKNRQILDQSFTRNKVNAAGSAVEIIEIWAKTIENTYDKVVINSNKIATAMPGPFDYENGISWIKDNKKYESLFQLNVKDMLANRLTVPKENILMANDAACFLSGEMFLAKGKKNNTAIGLTLGTGLGTAIFDHGEVKDAALWDSKFKNSIAEDYLSTRWFVNRYFEKTGIKVLNVKELVQSHENSRPIQQLFTEFAENLSDFIISFTEYFKPEVVVIGGNIAKAEHLFLPIVKKNFEKNNIKIPILISQLNENAAIVGAASLFYYR